MVRERSRLLIHFESRALFSLCLRPLCVAVRKYVSAFWRFVCLKCAQGMYQWGNGADSSEHLRNVQPWDLTYSVCKNSTHPFWCHGLPLKGTLPFTIARSGTQLLAREPCGQTTSRPQWCVWVDAVFKVLCSALWMLGSGKTDVSVLAP